MFQKKGYKFDDSGRLVRIPKKRKKVKVTVTSYVSRLVILKYILHLFGMLVQQLQSCQMDDAREYDAKIEALVEVLEVEDCGSVGGFDGKNPLQEPSDYKLLNRFATVMFKHNTVEEVENKERWHTYSSLIEFFDNLTDRL